MAMKNSLSSSVRVEAHARTVSSEARQSVREASAAKVHSRVDALERRFGDAGPVQDLAASIKRHVLDHLGELLEQFEAAAIRNGWEVIWARNADEACQRIIEICKSHQSQLMVKGKSMASEEIGLNHALAAEGISAIETDLGEYILQLCGDTPSHIVTPVIHKNRRQVAEVFCRAGLGEYSEDPQTLTGQARERLRHYFCNADVGLSGANFAVAESGRIVVVENEGNNRLSTLSPPVHIVLMGIEKLVPRDRDLALFLKLLSASAVGQDSTVYTHFILTPRQADGTGQAQRGFIVLLDNGRSQLLSGELRESLRCLRCGACLNVCPVYRQATGHAYGSVYPGPIGSVISPAIRAEDCLSRYRELPNASSLCGACEEVCPVRIPLPDLLVRLRRTLSQRRMKISGSPDFTLWSRLAVHPRLWRATLCMAAAFAAWAMPLLGRFGPKPIRRWLDNHAPVRFASPSNSFRTWWKNREGR